MKISFKRVFSVLCFAGLSSVFSFAQKNQNPLCILTLSPSANTTICQGGTTTISVTITSGGNPSPYQYDWNPTAGLGNPSANITAATHSTSASPSITTTYVVTVTDAASCSNTATVMVTVITLTATVTSTTVNCNGLCTGSASVTAGGGTPAYTYSWSPSGGTTSSATGLCAGDYTATVTDANGCTQTATVSITEPTTLTASIGSSTSINCNNLCTGSASVTAGGGTPAYTYSWSPSGGTTSSATGLCAGDYTATVTDANGCSNTNTVAIIDPTVLSTTVISTNATCGDSNGVATAFPSGGMPVYTYSWSNAQTTSAATGLASGTYTIIVTDANGCTKDTTVNVSNTPGPELDTVFTTVDCNGDSTGTATVIVTSGIGPPYTYLWSNGQTTSTATGLQAGTYQITVIDATPCSTLTSVTITELSALTASVTANNPACNGDSTGSAAINAGGGTPAYTYSWTPSAQTTPIATGLGSGNYTVTITDANSCKKDTIIIVIDTVVTASVTPSYTICPGQQSTLTASGGTTYLWNPSGSTTPVIIVSPTTNTTYTVIVFKGTCSDTTGVTITMGGATAIANPSPATICIGGNTTLTASGGLTYSWNPSGTGSTIVVTPATTGISSYTVTVTDANGCTGSAVANVNVVSAVNAISTGDSICQGEMATLTAQGGGTYSWNTGAVTSSISVSPPLNTIYTVTVSNGACDDTATCSVYVYSGPNVTASASPYTINLGGQSTLTGVTSTGVYNWIPSTGLSCTTCPNPVANPTITTTYMLCVTDINQCSACDTVTITVKIDCGDIFVPSAFSPNDDGHNDVFYVRSPCIKEIELSIYNRWGQKVFSTSDKTEGWDGKFHGKPVDPAVFFYKLFVRYLTNTIENIDGNVSLIR